MLYHFELAWMNELSCTRYFFTAKNELLNWCMKIEFSSIFESVSYAFTLFDDWTALEEHQSRIKNCPWSTSFRTITKASPQCDFVQLHRVYISSVLFTSDTWIRYNYVYRTICWFDAYTKNDNKGCEIVIMK